MPRFEFFMKNAADSCLRLLKIRLFDVDYVASKFAILTCCRVSMCQRIPSLHCLFLSMCTLFHVTRDRAGFVDWFHFAVACRIEFAYVCPQLWLELSLPLSLSLAHQHGVLCCCCCCSLKLETGRHAGETQSFRG